MNFSKKGLEKGSKRKTKPEKPSDSMTPKRKRKQKQIEN